MIHFADPRTLARESKQGFLWKEAPSLWTPPRRDWLRDPKILERFELLSNCFPLEPPTVIDQELWKALLKLKSDPNIYISPADKGGTLVLWRTREYEREALFQLYDRRNYLPIDQFELKRRLDNFKITRDRIINQLLNKNYISKREASAIKTSPCEASPIYFLPKIHKKINPKTRTFYGRPIVSTIRSSFHLLDKYLANITAPLLTEIPGSLRDTTHLLNSLPNTSIPQCTKIIAVDVNALYPSIPWEEGLLATVGFYRIKYPWLKAKARDKGFLDPPDPESFGEILRSILENSIISYKGSLFFHQIKGTAMGACISVFFANCYMWQITEPILIAPPAHILHFLRYIDDILIITTGDQSQIDETLKSITNDSISYSSNKLDTKTEFLDVTISINQKTFLIETAPFSKPTASPSYLHAHSMHPPHLIKSIPFAQLLRLKRNSSNVELFMVPALKMITRFLTRGYKKGLLQRTLLRVIRLDRETLLQPKLKKANFERFLKFIPTFDFHHEWKCVRTQLNALLREISKFYYSCDSISAQLQRTQIKVIFKRAENLAALWSPRIKNKE